MMREEMCGLCLLRLFLGAGGFGLLAEQLHLRLCGKAGCPEEMVLLSEALGAAACWLSGFYYGSASRITGQELLVSGFLAALFGAALMDRKQKKISNGFPAVILLLGLAGQLCFPEYGFGERFRGLLAGVLPPLLLYRLAPGTLGGGDVKLLGASGWFLGAGAVLAGMAVSFLLCGLAGTLLLLRKKAGRRTGLALAPFLAAGLALAVFRGEELVLWYLGK